MHQDQDQELSFARWMISYFVTTEHFMNTIALTLVVTYCAMVLQSIKVDSQTFSLLILVLSFYFKRAMDKDAK